MKVAITGKGGVGKTTLSSTLARLYADEGRTVLAADVDPDANLGLALGMTEEELGKWFAEKVGIAANVGSWFGQTGTCFRRLNMACPRTFVEDACQRIEKAVKELRK